MTKFSDDGKSFWDGTDWQPAISADGAWRWTGTEWVGNQPATAASKPTKWIWAIWLAAAAACLPLLLVIFGTIEFGTAVAKGDASAGSDLGVSLVFLSFAVALASPLGLRLAIRRGLAAAAAITAGALFLGTCGGGIALVAAYPVPSPTPGSHAVALKPSIAPDVPLSPSPSRNPAHSPSPTPKASASPTPSPSPSPSPTPADSPSPPPPAPSPVANLCGAPDNPWGYNFCGRGGLIYNPPADFCVYFSPCVSTFDTATSGYVVQCVSGKWSHSGGVRGACSQNGGVARSLYSGP